MNLSIVDANMSKVSYWVHISGLEGLDHYQHLSTVGVGRFVAQLSWIAVCFPVYRSCWEELRQSNPEDVPLAKSRCNILVN